MSEQQKLEVTQADRDAALPFVGDDYTKRGGYSDGYWIGRGDYDDHPLVQAFARHRTQSLSRPEGEEVERLIRRYGLHRGEATHVNQIRGALTAAIRNLAKAGQEEGR